MAAFVISKRFNGDYKFVFSSRKGKTIFTSLGFITKEDCEFEIIFLKNNLENCIFLPQKTLSQNFFFKMNLDNKTIATSRKYATELGLQKGINEILQDASKAETLEFDDVVFD